MLNGLYTAASGMLLQEKRLDILSNNLANINTTGFKMDTPNFESYIKKDSSYPQNIITESTYNKTINATSRIGGVYTDFSPGQIRQTGNKFDLALNNPKSFFAVDTPFGVRFTRSGNFTVNTRGELVTQEGFSVLSTNNNPIVIPEGDAAILGNGEISVNGANLDTIQVMEFEDNSKLQKTGYNLYEAVGTLPVASESPEVVQGYLEMSNINAVREMVNMITAQRAFETYQRVIRTIDTLNDRAANELGKIA